MKDKVFHFFAGPSASTFAETIGTKKCKVKSEELKKHDEVKKIQETHPYLRLSA
jgi:hypothetical protein